MGNFNLQGALTGIGRANAEHQQLKLMAEQLKLKSRIADSELKLKENTQTIAQEKLRVQVLKLKQGEQRQEMMREIAINEGFLQPQTPTQPPPSPSLGNLQPTGPVTPPLATPPQSQVLVPGRPDITLEKVKAAQAQAESEGLTDRRQKADRVGQLLGVGQQQAAPQPQQQAQAQTPFEPMRKRPSLSMGPGGLTISRAGASANEETAAHTAASWGIPQRDPRHEQVKSHVMAIGQRYSNREKSIALSMLREQVANGQRLGVERASVVNRRRFEDNEDQIQKNRVDRTSKALSEQNAKDWKAEKAVEKALGQVRSMYRPKFVGKGPFDKAQVGAAVDEAIAASGAENYLPGALMGSIRSFFNKPVEGETTFRRAALQVVDDILRARSGAAINEQEAERIKAFVFSLYDESIPFEGAFNRVLEVNQGKLQNILDVGTSAPFDLPRGAVTPFEQRQLQDGVREVP